MITDPLILTNLISDAIFLIFSFIVLIIAIKIALKWDINSTSIIQYNLEKLSYLSSTLIKYIFYIKIPLFLFFIFTLDSLSNIISGAMCAAGVIDAVFFGDELIYLKILNLYLFGFWIVIDNIDIKREDYPFTKGKFIFYIALFVLLVVLVSHVK